MGCCSEVENVGDAAVEKDAGKEKQRQCERKQSLIV
jgi:hypothetical protein